MGQATKLLLSCGFVSQRLLLLNHIPAWPLVYVACELHTLVQGCTVLIVAGFAHYAQLSGGRAAKRR